MAAIPPELRTQWDALVDRVGAPPSFRPGWVEAWWRHFGAGELDVLTVGDGSELRAVAPVGSRGPVLAAPANWETPSTGLLAIDAAARQGLAEQLFEGRPRCVAFDFLALEHGATEIEDAARKLGYRTLETLRMRSPFVVVSGDWEEFVHREVSTRHRQELRRLARRLDEQGAVTFEVDDGGGNLDARLDELFRVEASGWKAEATTAITSDERSSAFYRDIARWGAERGTLRLSCLRLDGQAIAADIMLEENGVLYGLKGGYDARFGRFGPGRLCRQGVLRWAFERRLSRCELLGRDDSYKLAWTQRVRERVRLLAFAPTAAGRLAYVEHAYARPLARRLLERIRVRG